MCHINILYINKHFSCMTWCNAKNNNALSLNPAINQANCSHCTTDELRTDFVASYIYSTILTIAQHIHLDQHCGTLSLLSQWLSVEVSVNSQNYFVLSLTSATHIHIDSSWMMLLFLMSYDNLPKLIICSLSLLIFNDLFIKWGVLSFPYPFWPGFVYCMTCKDHHV